MSSIDIVKGEEIVYPECMSEQKKFIPRLSVQLDEQKRRLVTRFKTHLDEMRFATGHKETLQDFVWTAVMKEAARRKWVEK